MVFNDVTPTSATIALLDSASTPTILRNQKFFIFSDNNMPWQNCNIVTINESQNIQFRQSCVTIILSEGFPFICERAMYATTTPQSFISYMDLKANNVHISTTVEKGQ